MSICTEYLNQQPTLVELIGDSNYPGRHKWITSASTVGQTDGRNYDS